jgi:hypothetical protein
MPSDAFQEHVLNAADVCSNCFSLVRVERERPERKWHPAESYYARNEATTTVDHVPAETVSESTQVFCQCGAGSAFTRVWSWRDITRERFKRLLSNLIQSLQRKGLQLDRQAFAAHALAAFDDYPHPESYGPHRESPAGCIDEALSTGLEASLRAQRTPSVSTSTA